MANGNVQRRLAVIVIADLVGYSRHMERDTAGTRERFGAIQQELVEPILAAHQGRIVKTMGDSFIFEFQSAVSAVEATVGFQRQPTEQEIDRDPWVSVSRIRSSRCWSDCRESGFLKSRSGHIQLAICLPKSSIANPKVISRLLWPIFAISDISMTVQST